MARAKRKFTEAATLAMNGDPKAAERAQDALAAVNEARAELARLGG